MKKVRRVISEKEMLSKKVMILAMASSSLNQLEEKLMAKGLKPYHRKEILTGIWFENKKLRLTTLGIGKEHLKEMTREQKRLDSLHHARNLKDRSLRLEK